MAQEWNNLLSKFNSTSHLYTINEEQKNVIVSVLQKIEDYYKSSLEIPSYNILVEGIPGSGKTYVLATLKNIFKSCSIPTESCATSAAVAIMNQGRTIHSLFKVPVVPSLQNDTRGTTNDIKDIKEWAKKSISYPVLFIDEISLVGTCLMTQLYLKWISSACKKKIILCFGDFKQFGPIGDNNIEKYIPKFFNATYLLTTSMRTSDNTSLSKILQHIRNDENIPSNLLTELSKRICDLDAPFRDFKNRISNSDQEHVSRAVVFHDNNQVQKFNNRCMTFLTGDMIKLVPRKYNPNFFQFPDTLNFSFNYIIEAKIGCIITNKRNNYEVNIHNGEQGKLVEVIIDEKNYKNSKAIIDFGQNKIVTLNPIAEESHGVIVIQFPFIVAAGRTVYSIQGETVGKFYVQWSPYFDKRMIYVILSRVKNLQDLNICYLLHDQPKKFIALIARQLLRSDNRDMYSKKPLGPEKSYSQKAKSYVSLFENIIKYTNVSKLH